MTPEPPPPPASFVHTVKYEGETLSIIAGWYLGDKRQFDVLAKVNPEIINPNLIKVGTQIKIPRDLMKTQEPLTKQFVDRHYFVHTVKFEGETLSIIAAWYLGDMMRFDLLEKANPEVINPALIKVGMKIRISEDVMKTRQPLPKDFVDKFIPAQPPTPPPKPPR